MEQISPGDVTNGTVTKYIRGLQLISSKKGSSESFYNFNGHGDVVQLTNSSGSITKQYSYDAFGVEQNKADSDVNPFRYCGEYFDSETGSMYLRARYYSPVSGRFMTEDPIGDGLNWYVYCDGNPVMFVDITGLYDRKAAVAYAKRYSVITQESLLDYDYNPPNVRFTQDCTNFVSFCLFKGGGMTMSDDWYYNYSVGTRDYVIGSWSATWTVSEEQFKAFTNCTGEFPNSNYSRDIAICIHESKWIPDAIEKYNIQEGDLLYFQDPKTLQMGHTAIIVSTDNGRITYAQHDDDKVDGDLGEYLDENINNPKAYTYVYVVRISDDA